MMETFKFLYEQASLALNVIPSESIISRIEEDLKSSILKLSGGQYTEDCWRALGCALAKDVHLLELDCSNCLLSDQGLIDVLSGLEKNRFLLTLNLKGNNIRSLGTEAIGKFLRHNNHLQNLCLEWNGVGIFPEKFAILCEGLICNKALKFLDLRENQLNDICAKTLSDVLVSKSTLQKLDLRWNNIGLIGGRALLSALSRNKSILSLEVNGNNLTKDLQNSIETIVLASVDRFLLTTEQTERTNSLTSKLKEVQEEKFLQLRSMMEVLDKKEKESSDNEKLNSSKITELKELLVEKVENLEALTSKVNELEKSLSITVEERNKFALSLNELEIRNKEHLEEYEKILCKERKMKEELEERLQKEIGSLKQENSFFKNQIHDLKNLQLHHEEKIAKLQTTVKKLDTQFKTEHDAYEEQLLFLKEQHSEILREEKLLHRKELTKLREEYLEIEKNLQQKILLLGTQKSELAEELKESRVILLTEKSKAEEILHQTEKKMKSEHEILKTQMEERIKILEDVNKNQEDLLKQHLQSMYTLKTNLTALDLALAEEKHREQYLEQRLAEKDAEKEAAIAKAKLEFKEQLEELDRSKLHIEVNDTTNLLKQNIKDLETKHQEDLVSKDVEIQMLKLQIQEEKNKFNQILEEEDKRTLQLRNAFEVYLASSNRIAKSSGFVPGDSDL
nr:leucine-rich repeat-containing protein 45 isoform X2 [Parasteatoda tepidariorum]